MDVRRLVLVALVTASHAAIADPDATNDVPAPVAKADKPATPPEQPLTLDEPRFSWHPFGFVRLQYSVVQNDPNVSFVGRDDGFTLQNARVGVAGRLRNRIAFEVSIDGAVDEREQINVPEGKLRVGLRDAYVDVALGDGLPHDASPSKLLVRGGLFETWIEPEAQVPNTKREFVDRPIESRGIRATEGFQTQGLTPGRSLGAAFRFEPPDQPANLVAGLELAVQNGADEFASNNDNDKPAVSLAGQLRLPHGTFVVAGVRYNPRTIGDLPFRQDEDDLQGSGGLRVVAGPIMIAGGVVVVRTSFPTTGGPSQAAFGGHAQLMVGVGGNALPIAFGYRFGILDPSSLIVTDRVMEHTAGVVLGVPRYYMRLQLQLTHVVEQGARELSNSRVQVAAEVSL